MSAATRSGRARTLALGAVVCAACAIALEAGLAHFAPWIRTGSEAFRGPPMPLVAGDYLPATTPLATDFRHRTAEFDVTYRFNAFGYRGAHPEALARPRDRERLLFVGDSFTLGWGNELADTFVERVAQRLDPRRVEVINGGYRGFLSPDAYYAYLKREGLALEPSLVIAVLFSGNDLEEMRDNRWLDLDERGMPTRLTTIRLYTDVSGDLLFPPGAREELVPGHLRVPVLRESRVWVGLGELAARARLGDARPRREVHRLGLIDRPLPVAEGWRRLELSLAAINELCRSVGAEVVYPMIAPANARSVPAKRARHAQMRSRVTRSGAPVIDLLWDLRPQHFLGEGHLDAEGNRRVADRVLRFLADDPRFARWLRQG